MTPTDSVQIAARIGAVEQAALRKIADRNDRSVSAELRRAIRQHIEFEEAKQQT